MRLLMRLITAFVCVGILVLIFALSDGLAGDSREESRLRRNVHNAPRPRESQSYSGTDPTIVANTRRLQHVAEVSSKFEYLKML